MAAKHPPALLLMGPTASGKTALALKLAERLPVDIVSVDSAQVFRDMNIGTAKPDTATLARFPHRLIDLISPEQRYSAARFREDALLAMAEIAGRGRIPLLVGGTMLYFKVLRDGLADLPEADPAIRAEIDRWAKQFGWPALHKQLAEVDPATAARLAPTDSQRIQRALEVVRLTGRPMADTLAHHRSPPLPYRVLSLALFPSDRAAFHRTIAARFEQMLANGLVAEVEALRGKYCLSPDLPSMRCVGYRQTWAMLEGQFTARELSDRGIFATRQFAKRQLTWLRTTPGLTLFDSLDPRTEQQVLSAVDDFLG